MIESLYFTAGFLVIVVVIAILACYMDRRNEKADKAERRRIAECTHSHGFLTVKVFGYPDLKKCVDCGRIFELDGTEVDLDYLEDFIENTDRWIENSDGGRELKIYLTREQFRKIYRISMERKMTMDDMIGKLIDGLK
jgi:hypothetical protein